MLHDVFVHSRPPCQITSVKVMTDPFSNTCIGHGFVEFSDDTSFRRGLKKTGCKVAGAYIRVSPYQSGPEPTVEDTAPDDVAVSVKAASMVIGGAQKLLAAARDRAAGATTAAAETVVTSLYCARVDGLPGDVDEEELMTTVTKRGLRVRTLRIVREPEALRFIPRTKPAWGDVPSRWTRGWDRNHGFVSFADPMSLRKALALSGKIVLDDHPDEALYFTVDRHALEDMAGNKVIIRADESVDPVVITPPDPVKALQDAREAAKADFRKNRHARKGVGAQTGQSAAGSAPMVSRNFTDPALDLLSDLRNLIYSKGTKTVNAVFQRLDTDGSGGIDTEEWLKEMESLGLSRKKARTAMKHIDVDRDGSLTLDEMRACFEHPQVRGYSVVKRLTKDQLQQVVKFRRTLLAKTGEDITTAVAMVDEDGGGTIDLQEWCNAFDEMELDRSDALRLFRVLDMDNLGEINTDEAITILDSELVNRLMHASNVRKLQDEELQGIADLYTKLLDVLGEFEVSDVINTFVNSGEEALQMQDFVDYCSDMGFGKRFGKSVWRVLDPAGDGSVEVPALRAILECDQVRAFLTACGLMNNMGITRPYQFPKSEELASMVQTRPKTVGNHKERTKPSKSGWTGCGMPRRAASQPTIGNVRGRQPRLAPLPGRALALPKDLEAGALRRKTTQGGQRSRGGAGRHLASIAA